MHLRAQPKAASWFDTDMIEDIIERVDFMQLSEGTSVVLGGFSLALEEALSARGITPALGSPATLDEEQPWPIEPVDYIFAIRTLSTLNDLPGALIHLRGALNEGGIAFAQILGAGTLPALRQIMLEADGDAPAARIHPQIDNRSASALLARAGFMRQVVDSRTLTVRFSSFERMIADLREQALTGILADRPPNLTKAALARAHAKFDELRDAEGKVSESFEVLSLTAWR